MPGEFKTIFEFLERQLSLGMFLVNPIPKDKIKNYSSIYYYQDTFFLEVLLNKGQKMCFVKRGTNHKLIIMADM